MKGLISWFDQIPKTTHGGRNCKVDMCERYYLFGSSAGGG